MATEDLGSIRSYQKLITDHDKRIKKLEAGNRTAGLAYSSIQDGAINAYDSDGVLQQTIGRQADGTYAIQYKNGALPPIATAPTVTPLMSGLSVAWDGAFYEDAARPASFHHVEVHVSTVSDFAPDDLTFQGVLSEAGSWPVSPLDTGTVYYARLWSVNNAGGRASAPSPQASGTPDQVVAQDILDGIVTEVKLADDAVTAAKIAAGAVGSAQLGDQVVDLSKLADGSVDATKLVDGSVGEAQLSDEVNSSLADAETNAAQGVSDAAAALSVAQAAQAAADGAIRTYYQSDAPTGLNDSTDLGDLWFDMDTNQAYRWNGTSWVLIEDNQIAAALQAAQNAQTTADGKITSFFQATAPTGAAVGDLWYDTSNGNLAKWWDGSAWQPVPVGTGALGDGAVDGDKLADGAVDASKVSFTAGDIGGLSTTLSASAPSDPNMGDVWIDSGHGNVLKRWDGSSWVVAATGTEAIQAAAITSTLLASDAVVAGKIAAGAVQAGNIDANAVTADTVAAGAIGANQLAANAVVAGKIAAAAVQAGDLDVNAVQAGNIAAAAVQAGDIAADAVTTGNLKALAVTAAKIATNSITAGHIQAGAVTADKLESDLALVSKIIAGDPNGWRVELGDATEPILYWNGTETGLAVSADTANNKANVYVSGRVDFGQGSQIDADYVDLLEQPASGYATPTPRQARSWVDSGPKTSVTARWTSATQPGNFLLATVYVRNDNLGGVAPSITAPSGWTRVTSVSGSGAAHSLAVYAYTGAPSRTTETFTANVSSNWAISLTELTNVTGVDRYAASNDSLSPAPTGTTATTTQTDETWVAVWGVYNVVYGSNYQFTNPTNGFTIALEGIGAANFGYVLAAKHVTSTGAASSSLDSSGPALGAIVTLKTAPATSGTPPVPSANHGRFYTRDVRGITVPYVIDSTGLTYPLGGGPRCRVVMRSAGASITAPNANTWAQSDWQVAAGDDPYGMVAVSTSAGTYSSITIGMTGVYDVAFKAAITGTLGGSAYVAFIARNAVDIERSIARDVRNHNDSGSDGAQPYAATTRLLQAGDILYWGTWSDSGGYTIQGNLHGVTSEMLVTWRGPR